MQERALTTGSMCGIAGILSSKPIELTSIELMTNALLHRGPDAQGIIVDESRRIALGHTRLSIIDLTSGANQPFYSGNKRYVVVFNGEIYNFNRIKDELVHQYGLNFKTNSDTEVIVEAFATWGQEMVDKLEGMFSIVIVDLQLHKMYLFRDRIGKKPLYYYHSEYVFVFASEMKSLLKYEEVARNKGINRKIISSFLHLGYIPEPHTIYSGIRKFPAGSIGEIGRELKLSIRPYWKIEDKIDRAAVKNVSEAKEHLSVLLNRSVQKRLISDVPLGAFLSGGTDSSLVAAIASRNISTPLKTFSIGFKEAKYDERYYAREVAAHLKTDHTEYLLSEKEAIGLLETYLHHFDEPFADTSAIPTMLVSKLAKEKVTVALTGDGGDELFQGYGSYKWANRLSMRSWRLVRPFLRHAFRISGINRLQRVAHMLSPVKSNEMRSHIFSQEQYFFEQREIRDELLKHNSDFSPFHYDESFLPERNFDEGEKQALFDLQFYLKDDLLVKVDRASMFFGLECRCPLLDHEVVEYALALDHSLKIRNGKTKWILKELLRDLIPDHLVDRPKWGFSVPLMNWLKKDLRYLIATFLSEDCIREVGLFNTVYVHELIKDFFSGKDYLYNRLWAIIVIHKWWKENQ